MSKINTQHMSKEDAIELMKQGVKMTHTYFTPEEWVYISKGGEYVLEDGVECSHHEFWQWRQAEFWQDGWERWEDLEN